MKIKYLFLFVVLFVCMSTTTSCTIMRVHRHPHKEVPPGHKKKKHGRKSARFDAPGHHKHWKE